MEGTFRVARCDPGHQLGELRAHRRPRRGPALPSRELLVDRAEQRLGRELALEEKVDDPRRDGSAEPADPSLGIKITVSDDLSPDSDDLTA